MPIVLQQFLFELLQHRFWSADDVAPAAIAKELNVIFADHAAVHYPDAIALAIPSFHHLHDVFNSCHIGRISCEDLIAQRHAALRNNQSNADLFKIASLIELEVGSTFEKRAGNIVYQQITFQIKQLAHAILQMNFEGLLVRHQLFETSIEPIIVDIVFGDTRQVRQ